MQEEIKLTLGKISFDLYERRKEPRLGYSVLARRLTSLRIIIKCQVTEKGSTVL